MVVIVVDLSDPAGLLPTLMWWVEAVKRKLGATYDKFEKKGLQLPEQLRQRAKSKLYSANEDKDAVYHSGISLVIAATKYDAFKNQDPEVKKVMSRCGQGGGRWQAAGLHRLVSWVAPVTERHVAYQHSAQGAKCALRISCARRFLRFVAHAHGAFLCYLSGLHGSSGDGSAAEDAQLLDNFTRLMNHLIFTGLEKKP